jgi:hypothetical protein
MHLIYFRRCRKLPERLVFCFGGTISELTVPTISKQQIGVVLTDDFYIRHFIGLDD